MNEMLPENTSAEYDYANDTEAVILEHLSAAKPCGAGALSATADILRGSYRSFDGRRNVVGAAIDVAERITYPTTVLATLFEQKSPDLPEQWITDKEITRTVLLIFGHIESGYLRAQQVSLEHEGGNAAIDARIVQLTDFMNALAQKRTQK
jgi:hypothetical protein